MNKCEPIESQWQQCGAFNAPFFSSWIHPTVPISLSAYEWQLQRRILVAILNTHFPILRFANERRQQGRETIPD